MQGLPLTTLALPSEARTKYCIEYLLHECYWWRSLTATLDAKPWFYFQMLSSEGPLHPHLFFNSYLWISLGITLPTNSSIASTSMESLTSLLCYLLQDLLGWSTILVCSGVANFSSKGQKSQKPLSSRKTEAIFSSLTFRIALLNLPAA